MTDEPEPEVIVLSPGEWDAAVQRSLDELGLTFEDLAAQAAARDFSSIEANKLWLIIGPRSNHDAQGGAS